ncbi:hypothetical protein [Streptomyces sp. NPDC051286]|uniref:hypothetical protein n=1 Tax=Streptomyces sp. NPDC051286 TaxID=3365647 RepID=UPI0037A685E1
MDLLCVAGLAHGVKGLAGKGHSVLVALSRIAVFASRIRRAAVVRASMMVIGMRTSTKAPASLWVRASLHGFPVLPDRS